MSNKVDFFMQTDTTTDRVPEQNLDPVSGFGVQAAANLRTVNGTVISDQTVTHRGSKTILWSSEGTSAGQVALTANQKKASGTSGTLDLSPYSNVVLIVVAGAPSGGSSPSLQFELDLADDAGTPNVFAIWKPTALTAAGNYYLCAGRDVPFVQAASAPATAPSNVVALNVPSNWSFGLVPLLLGPNGQIAWTVTGGPTGWSWTAWLYGLN